MHLYRSFIRALIAVQIFSVVIFAHSEMHVGDFSRNLRVKEIKYHVNAKLNSLKLICCKSVDYTEQLTHKQGRLLRATLPTLTLIRKLIFLSGVVGCFHTNNFILLQPSALLCFSVCIKKSEHRSRSIC